MNGLKNQTIARLGECFETFCGIIRINHHFLSIEFYRLLIDFRPPTKFREGSLLFSVMSVCLSVGQSVNRVLCEHYPWCHWSVTGPMGIISPTPTPSPCNAKCNPSRHVQTCSPHPTGTSGHVQTYWKAGGWPSIKKACLYCVRTDVEMK